MHESLSDPEGFIHVEKLEKIIAELGLMLTPKDIHSIASGNLIAK
jgi:hypothetical protein